MGGGAQENPRPRDKLTPRQRRARDTRAARRSSQCAGESVVCAICASRRARVARGQARRRACGARARARGRGISFPGRGQEQWWSLFVLGGWRGSGSGSLFPSLPEELAVAAFPVAEGAMPSSDWRSMPCAKLAPILDAFCSPYASIMRDDLHPRQKPRRRPRPYPDGGSDVVLSRLPVVCTPRFCSSLILRAQVCTKLLARPVKEHSDQHGQGR